MEEIEGFADWLRENERSENTVDCYTRAAELYFKDFKELTKQNMMAFKQEQLRKWSPKTAANRVTAMNQFCVYSGKPECKVKRVKIHKANTLENVITEEQ